MNEVNIAKFLQLTEEYLRCNGNSLSERERENVNELYEDLSAEYHRQQLFDELYN